MHALDGGDPRDAARLQPVEEFRGGARIGAAGVRIPDLRGDEQAARLPVPRHRRLCPGAINENMRAASRPTAWTAPRVSAMTIVSTSQA